MTKQELQSAVGEICKSYGVPSIKLQFSEGKGRGLACYVTLRYRIGGKIQKKHHPKNITVYSWEYIKDHKGEVAMRVGHELAHHIKNMKTNSLMHNTAFYNLEETVASRLSRMLK